MINLELEQIIMQIANTPPDERTTSYLKPLIEKVYLLGAKDYQQIIARQIKHSNSWEEFSNETLKDLLSNF